MIEQPLTLLRTIRRAAAILLAGQYGSLPPDQHDTLIAIRNVAADLLDALETEDADPRRILDYGAKTQFASVSGHLERLHEAKNFTRLQRQQLALIEDSVSQILRWLDNSMAVSA